MTELRDQLQQTLGDSYRLEQELGGGGMSRVFVAHETSLGRKVVVKVLPPEMAAAVSIDRFRREIQLAAQLQHPHIVPLLSAGETGGLPYFTMPFVRGESLRSRLAHGGELPISEAVRTLREVASALAYAHENHVVHRDIKPENILISGGSAMVTDFGVAKAVSASSGAGVSPAGSLTSMGVALGTPSYMAPEQATADPNTDHRADIYALGVVAYEMLIGSTPFAGRSPPAMLAAHVTEAPETVSRRRPGVPPLLAALVMKCLEKRPADRPQTAGEVVHELDSLTTPSGGLAPTAALPAAQARNRFGRRAAIGAAAAVALLLVAAALRVSQSLSPREAVAAVPAIAVLPFENRGSEERQEFTDGMTEEITNRLSSIRGLRVIGRQSSRAYAVSDKTPQEIAGELGVQYVLTGTVRWDRGADGREVVRVSPALLRTSDATQVWADAYQTVLSGMFEVQSKVATEVANALNVALLAPERDVLGAKPTENVEAYSLYLRGNELLTQEIDPYKIGQAIEAIERAVAADSGFALAWARLSLAHTEYFWFYGDRSADRLRKAKAAVDRAFSLNPRLPEAHLALGAYHYHGFLDYDKALEQFSRAERGKPSDFEPIFFKAAVQRRQGKWRESIGNMARAVELEPRVGAYTADFASTHFYLRDYDAAERLVDRSLIVNPTLSLAHNLKAGIAIARDANLSGAVRIIRNRFDSEPDRALAANAVLGVPVVAAMDPVMRQAMIQVEWQPAFGEKTFFLLNKARLFRAIGDQSRARANADSAAAILISKVRERPDDADPYASLALAQAYRGRKAEAIAAIDRAIALRPLARDAYGGADMLGMKADMLVLLGEEEAAISVFERLLAIPSGVSANQLWLLSDYASLRDNPRFRRLVNH